MSVDLTNDDGDEFGFANTGWFRLLALARAHGWSSDGGTDSDDDVPEQFSSHQANVLADALERGLGTGDDAEVARRVSQELTRLLVTQSASPMFSNDPIRFDANDVRYWRAFIAFARRGGFSVS